MSGDPVYKKYDYILEYDPVEDIINTLYHMIHGREKHAVSVVPADDYLQQLVLVCQWCASSLKSQLGSLYYINII